MSSDMVHYLALVFPELQIPVEGLVNTEQDLVCYVIYPQWSYLPSLLSVVKGYMKVVVLVVLNNRAESLNVVTGSC